MKRNRVVFLTIKGALPALAVLIAGCGSDNMSDAVTRNRDIARETAAQLAQDYGQIEGDYVSDPAASDLPVRATLQMTRVQQDGAIVPQPTISGSITITDLPAATSVHSRLDPPLTRTPTTASSDGGAAASDTTIPFSTGVYDPASGDLAIRISGFTAPGANVSCLVALPRMDCLWVPVGSGNRFHFTLVKQS